MKKLFVEPKVKKIEININENIASSGNQHISFVFQAWRASCWVQQCGVTVGRFMSGEFDGMSESDLKVIFHGCYEYVSDSATFNGIRYTIR